LTGELSRTDVKEISLGAIDAYKEIKPEKELPVRELNDIVGAEFDKAAMEARIQEVAGDSAEKGLSDEAGENLESNTEKNLDPIHKECLTTSRERKDFAGSSKGEWDGEVGNSKLYPESAEAKEALSRYGQDGIDYIDGEPDFSKVSEATVKIDDMTSERYGEGKNFDQANHMCAKQWNNEAKDGKNDWEARDVEKWRTHNHYTWHERLDRKTMDLVQGDIHRECKHFGGVSECKRYEAAGKENGSGFDD